MTRNRDIKEHERDVDNLEKNISKNAKDMDNYTASISQSRCLIDDLESDLAKELNDMKDNIIELNALKTADIEDKERLDELRRTLDVMKNGSPEPVKAFLNPRHESEKTISHFCGGSL
ncbi:MAG: hypothetical protein E4G94_09055 [ANME-2 cluster archaeon]|nr:MAG: hypothetical protein E4G94_09055 [ANME-2 cluster archaeon]